LDCQIRESAVANLHIQEAAGLDWERGDVYEKSCLGRALGGRRAQERCVKLDRAVRLAGRVHKLVGVCKRAGQTDFCKAAPGLEIEDGRS
jgi:hypothetical protein